MNNTNDKNQLRNSFDEIFSKVPEKIELTGLEEMLDGKKPKTPVRVVNYADRRNAMYNKAQKTVNSLLKFYLNENIISEDEYIQQRAEQEKSTLSDLMNQIENMNDIITSMMHNIDSGDVSPRTFEVLSEVERTFIELLKMKSMHLIQIEESMKKLVNDRNLYNRSNEVGSGDVGSEGFSSRGTKKLMRQMREMIDTKNAEEIDIEE